MIIYISNRSEVDIGSVTHHTALCDIFGAENVLKIDLRASQKPERSQNYIAYGKYSSRFMRVFGLLQGNTPIMSNRIMDDICSLIREQNIKLVFTEESIFGNLAKRIKREFPETKYAVFYHDIAADLYRQWNRQAKFINKLDNWVGIRGENISRANADMNLVFHQEDAQKLWNYYHIRPTRMIPLTAFTPVGIEGNLTVTASDAVKEVLFVGSAYYPNILGIRWFHENVLPMLSDKIKVRVVGKISAQIRDLPCSERFIIEGMVDDLKPYYESADIVIAPLFDGGGMKVKTMEAISYAKCFLGTSESLHGFWEKLDQEQNHTVFCSEDPEQWAEILNRLADSEIKKFNPGLYRCFKDNFSYERLLRDFKELFDAEKTGIVW